MASATDESSTTQNETEHLRGFHQIIGRLNKARFLAKGKTRLQDLVRIYMTTVKPWIGAHTMRITFDQWRYQDPDFSSATDLPLLNPQQNHLVSQVLQQASALEFSQEHQLDSETLNHYFESGIQHLALMPLLNHFNQAMGVVEVTFKSHRPEELPWSLLETLTDYLANLLEIGQSSTEKATADRQAPSKGLLGKLVDYEQQIQQLQERESLFHSLIGYFHSTLKMVDAWNYLKMQTAEGEINQYDFQKHADRYVERAFKFADLLHYANKVQTGKLQPDLTVRPVLKSLYESIGEFTRYHQQAPLNIRTEFPSEEVQAVFDNFLLRTALMFCLEHQYLISATQKYLCILVISIQDGNQQVQVNIGLEADPVVRKWEQDPAVFEVYMEEPLDEFGLKRMFLPFVELAIQATQGSLTSRTEEGRLQSLIITLPKPDAPDAP